MFRKLPKDPSTWIDVPDFSRQVPYSRKFKLDEYERVAIYFYVFDGDTISKQEVVIDFNEDDEAIITAVKRLPILFNGETLPTSPRGSSENNDNSQDLVPPYFWVGIDTVKRSESRASSSSSESEDSDQRSDASTECSEDSDDSLKDSEHSYSSKSSSEGTRGESPDNVRSSSRYYARSPPKDPTRLRAFRVWPAKRSK